MKIRILLIFIGLFFPQCLLVAQEVKLNINFDQKRWINYPNNLDKVTYKWDKNILLVRVIVEWNSSSSINSKNASVHWNEKKINIFYELTMNKIDKKNYSIGFSAPVILDFSISGISKGVYQITVSPKHQKWRTPSPHPIAMTVLTNLEK